jgi:phosphatidylglycerol:prolipoprotein diacylglycerol transferase
MYTVPISFPGLHLSFNVQPELFHIGNFALRWYGLIIAAGLLIALLYNMKRANSFHITVDDFSDVVIFSVIFAIIGARLYYVIFDPNIATDYTSIGDIVQIWNGGLGIYGAIIAAFVTAFIVCRIKKISVGAVFDLAGLGFLIGQAIGRWGNFFNREAFGNETNSLFRMVVDASGKAYHPCFFYESLWCVLGFVLLHTYSKHRKFNGEIFLMYVMWYGFGRFFIESLRTDSLVFGTMKVSMIVAAITFITALTLYIIKASQIKRDGIGGLTEYKSVYGDAMDALRAEEKSALSVFEDEDENIGLENEDDRVTEDDDDDDNEKTSKTKDLELDENKTDDNDEEDEFYKDIEKNLKDGKKDEHTEEK